MLETVFSALLTLLGAMMTTYAAFTHTSVLMAPGALFIFVGACWVGNVLARRDVNLFAWRSTAAREAA